jgi:peptidoglycan/LPS O-acetylase OafA/YrhL
MHDHGGGAGRIAHLDGLRGVAILGVIVFHAFARWPELVPYGQTYASFPLFAKGWLGVELFFMISGFVILMTLERCDTFGGFLYRRWLRLFPAMLFCSVLIFASAPLFPERPAGAPTWPSLLPGLTLVQPWVWRHLFGEFPELEGAFWSLFVEVKFYLLVGALYFLAGRKVAILGVVLLFAVSALLSSVALPAIPFARAAKTANELSDARLFGWFAVGALFYDYLRTGSARTFGAAAGVAILAAAALPDASIGSKAAAVGVAALFAASFADTRLQRICSHRAMLFVGFVSYPLYLLHENMTVAMIAKLGPIAPHVPGLLLPILPIACVVALSWFVARHVEPRLARVIRGAVALRRRGATRVGLP